MYIDQHLIIGLLLGLSANSYAEAPDIVTLKLTPDRCVTLQHGRLCYANISIQWKSNQLKDVCLHAGTEKLNCWHSSPSGQWQYEFVARDSQTLKLISDDAVIAEAIVKVNWVQKKPIVKRHWRLF